MTVPVRRSSTADFKKFALSGKAFDNDKTMVAIRRFFMMTGVELCLL